MKASNQPRKKAKKNNAIAAKAAIKKRARAARGAGQTLGDRRGDALERMKVTALCREFSLVRPDLTRMLSYSLRTVDKWAAGEKPGEAPQRRINELYRLLNALGEIMDPGYVGEWLKTPNEAFDGSTPLQVIERGETDRIWRMIFLAETGTPA